MEKRNTVLSKLNPYCTLLPQESSSTLRLKKKIGIHARSDGYVKADEVEYLNSELEINSVENAKLNENSTEVDSSGKQIMNLKK